MDVQYLSETYCLLTAFPMTLDMQMLQVLRGEFRWLGRVRGTFDYIMERMEAVACERKPLLRPLRACMVASGDLLYPGWN